MSSGMYQHDVDAAALRRTLSGVVESCVNTVGVDVNSASVQLLTRVAGVGPSLAATIVAHRATHVRHAHESPCAPARRIGGRHGRDVCERRQRSAHWSTPPCVDSFFRPSCVKNRWGLDVRERSVFPQCQTYQLLGLRHRRCHRSVRLAVALMRKRNPLGVSPRVQTRRAASRAASSC